jgi:uncharacterized protein YlxW (UPF0749 family)
MSTDDGGVMSGDDGDRPGPAEGHEHPGTDRSPREPLRGRARLRSALKPRATRAQVVAAVLCAVLGFAAAVQVRANQDAGLTGLRQSDLVGILDDVSQRGARLQTEARELQEIRDRVSGGSNGTIAALEEARDRARVLGILAGTLPARGPGIELTITDNEGQVGADVLLDTLQELRDAGAEAIELSTLSGPAVRVVASTSLVDVEGGVSVDGTVLEPPYRFKVIGESRTLAAALDIPGGVLDVIRQRKAQADVSPRPTLLITSLRATPSPRYARPAAEDDDD